MPTRKIQGFEDLIAWQRGMDLATHVYSLSRNRPFSRDFALADQTHRSAISVPSNIAEGYERGSRAEFYRFLTIAKGSCGETRTQIRLAERLGYLDAATASEALREAEDVSRIISKLRTSVAKQRDTPKK
jgi:four helix bundle protein